MRIQKTGPDSVLVVADNTELTGDIESHARAALVQEGIEVPGRPDCDAYTAGGETLIFARARQSAAYYQFSCAEDLIDAARLMRRLGLGAGATLLRGRDCYYIACTGAAPDAVLGEYAQRLPGLPRETCRNFDEGAFEKLGI